MNHTDDVRRPGLILTVVLAGLIGIGVVCATAPGDPGDSTPAPTVVVSTMR
jgi:ABC-type transporter Mla subunit MlaD